MTTADYWFWSITFLSVNVNLIGINLNLTKIAGK